MKNLYSFFFSHQSASKNFLTFFRISIGGFCLLRFLAIKKDFFLLYAKDGIIPSDVGELFKIKFIPGLSNYSDFLNSYFGFSEYTSLMLFQYLYIIFAVFMILGLLSRSSSVALLFLHLILAKGTHLYAYGVDYFTVIALFYCCIFPVGSQNSMDSFFFTKRPINPAPYRRILQLHLCMVYFFSGLDKLVGYNWWNGESIWKAVHQPFFNLDFGINFEFMAAHPFIPITMGWLTIATELLYPFFIWKNPYRKIWLVLVVSMHIGILITLNLYFFSTIMILLNFSALLNFSGTEATVEEKDRSLTKSFFTKRIFNFPLKGIIQKA